MNSLTFSIVLLGGGLFLLYAIVKGISLTALAWKVSKTALFGWRAALADVLFDLCMEWHWAYQDAQKFKARAKENRRKQKEAKREEKQAKRTIKALKRMTAQAEKERAKRLKELVKHDASKPYGDSAMAGGTWTDVWKCFYYGMRPAPNTGPPRERPKPKPRTGTPKCQCVVCRNVRAKEAAKAEAKARACVAKVEANLKKGPKGLKGDTELRSEPKPNNNWEGFIVMATTPETPARANCWATYHKTGGVYKVAWYGIIDQRLHIDNKIIGDYCLLADDIYELSQRIKEKYTDGVISVVAPGVVSA